MDYLSIDSLVKIVALIASALVVFQSFTNIPLNKKAKLRAEYEFSEKLLIDNKWLTMPDYLLEKGYLVMSGIPLKANEIRFLLNMENPLSKFELFQQAKDYLICTTNDDGNYVIEYNDNYLSKNKAASKFFYMLAYAFFALLAGTPLIFLNNIIQEFGLVSLWGIIFWCIPFGFIAISCVRVYWNFRSAEEIMRNNWSAKAN